MTTGAVVTVEFWWRRKTKNASCHSNSTSGELGLRNRVIQSAAIDKLNRQHPSEVEAERHVVLVVGITGAGKSSTANTLRGSRAHAFEVRDLFVAIAL